MQPNVTARDQFDRLTAIVRRAIRYWWLVAGIAVIGGVLAVLFALAQKPVYESETVLLYREVIPTSVIQGRDVSQSTRNLSSRYREMLMARGQLQQVAEEFELFGASPDKPVADDMRTLVDFRSKGTGTFRIVFRSGDPALAQKVTARLAEQLIEEDRRISREEASTTQTFLVEQKERADIELKKRERAKAQFLADHPEFADESGGGSGAGASVRAAAANKKDIPKRNVDPRVLALERQRNRLRDRLAAPDEPVARPATRKIRSSEQIAAEARVAQAQREVDQLRSELDDRLSRFTDKHPDVIKARNAFDDAQRRLRRAEAAVPADDSDDPIVAGPIDRDALAADLQRVERDLTAMRAKVARETPDDKREASTDDATSWVVQLETDWSRLARDVEESRDRVESLEAKVFTAEITADSVAAQTSKLTVIDPANEPQRPIGKGKTIIVLAGLLLFGGLGVAMALGLAFIDDRIYTRWDLDQAGVAPMLVEVPRPDKRGKQARSAPPPARPGNKEAA